eukprot:TRINITY_DN15710_c0_g1_i2.p1 TRINITY_DN15710_c0_g1~~TRINITY_DN15710_c0_g1_i2.p1  ORF type:complete len:393 (-),score=117.32 TRINITY_DN15710_c0_g1_i2:406-1584(-)
MQFFGGRGFPMGGGSFEQSYHVYPVSFIDKPHLENGDKVIMPPSALDRLAQLHIDYPMLFEVTNPVLSKSSHCGVLEFIAEEGVVYMPYWMMQNLLLQEGALVTLKSATLPKGSYVKLQPHTKDFLDISNPKAVLETTLRNFSCLTVGDNIMVAYNNKKYYIDIVEAKPARAITIIETDCEVDFAPPLDYEEPERPQKGATGAINGKGKAKVDGAAGSSAGATGRAAGAAGQEAQPSTAGDAAGPPPEPDFKAFVGTGRRLDGKAAKLSEGPLPAVAPSTSAAPQGTTSAAGVRKGSGPSLSAANGSSGLKDGAVDKAQATSGAAAAKPRAAGKLVFGGGRSGGASAAGAPTSANGSAKEAPKKDAKEKEKEAPPPVPSFQAFTGKGRSLRD